MTGCTATGGREQWALASTSHRAAKSSAWTSKANPHLIWTGPAVAPLAVAAVFHLYGPIGVLEHPGLVTLRVGSEGLH